MPNCASLGRIGARRLVRAKDLEQQEMQDKKSRRPHVASVTSGKRLLLTREILNDLEYDDVGALALLSWCNFGRGD